MPRPPINFSAYIKLIPQHTAPLPIEASQPHLHYVRYANDNWNLLLYVERNFKSANVYAAASARHMQSLRVMVLLSLVEALERLLKELPAACIDQVSQLVTDDRLNVFTMKGDAFSSQYAAGGTLGRTLCDPIPWCDCDQTNERFRKIHSDPYEPGPFYVLPKGNQLPVSLRGRYDLMSIIWQLRHTIVHNSGVLTPSDAHKLRVFCKAPVAGHNRLAPTRGDVSYVKLFLDETAERIHSEVAARLATLLTRLHAEDITLFDASIKAQEIANIFRLPLTVAAQTRNPI